MTLTGTESLPPVRVGRAIRRHALLIVLLAIVCGAAAFVGTLRQTATYEVMSSVLFRFEREYFPRNAAEEGWLGDGVRIELADAIHTELAILGSRSVIKAALDEMGGPAQWEAASKSGGPAPLLDRVRSTAAELRESVAAGDAAAPARVPADPALVAVAYEERVLADIREALSIRRVEGTSVAEIRLVHPDPEFAAEFVNRIVANYLGSRRSLFGGAPLLEFERQTEAANARVDAAEEALTDFRLANRLFDIPGQRSELLAVRQGIEEEIRAAPPDSRATPASTGQDGDDSRLEARLREVEDALQNLVIAEGALASLQRDLDGAKAAADLVNRLYRQQRLATDLEAAAKSPITVVDPALPNDRRTGLPPLLQVLLGLAVGLVLGTMAAIMLERRRPPPAGIPVSPRAEVPFVRRSARFPQEPPPAAADPAPRDPATGGFRYGDR